MESQNDFFGVQYFMHPTKGRMALLYIFHGRDVMRTVKHPAKTGGKADMVKTVFATDGPRVRFPDSLSAKLMKSVGGFPVDKKKMVGYRVHPDQVRNSIALMQAQGYVLSHAILSLPETLPH